MKNEDRQIISEILVKYGLSTRQAAIIEIARYVESQRNEIKGGILEMIEQDIKKYKAVELEVYGRMALVGLRSGIKEIGKVQRVK